VSLQPATSSSRKVSADLVGLYFNCFTEDHVACQCPNPSCCFRYREPGHQAKDCVCPHRSLISLQSGSRGNDWTPPPPSACLCCRPLVLMPQAWSLSPSSDQAPSLASHSTEVPDWLHPSDSSDDISDPMNDGLTDLQGSCWIQPWSEKARFPGFDLLGTSSSQPNV
jgi:hypothetical protein